MPFKNRREAGQKLAEELTQYEGNAIVLGLPRGGVPVGYEVAKRLKVPLDITCPHKIGAPQNPEFAIGAVTERGEAMLNDDIIRQLKVPESYLTEQITKETKQARERLKLYRKSDQPRDVKGKVVILVDDGLATGSTMKAAIVSIQKEAPAKIVVAVPVSPIETAKSIEEMVDEVVCLHKPLLFQAVGFHYEDFTQVTDEEVIKLLT